MLNFLKIYSCCISVIIFRFLIIKADSTECNSIVIEDGEKALMNIFKDVQELKDIANKLRESNEFQLENYNSMPSVVPYFDERIDMIPEKCYKTLPPKDCASATACIKRSGIYKIQVEQYSYDPFYVACDDETENGDWLIIQKRQDGSVDFYRNWVDYENGFGDIEGEFFIGLKKLHALTNYNGPQELLIVMEDAKGIKAYAKYDSFAIGNETEAYNLKRIGKYSGTAGDSLQRHIGMKFSTKDRDNDTYQKGSCAVEYTGAWWYTYCHNSNLNGKYGDNKHAKGVNWKTFRSHNTSLPYVKMMIRRSLTL